MRRPPSISATTIIALFATVAVSLLVLVLDGAARQWLAGGIFVAGIGIHLYDLRAQARHRAQAISEAAAILQADAAAPPAPAHEPQDSQQRPGA